MHRIPQRLARLFMELLNSERPVNVATLAQKLGVSARTVFRELENADALLRNNDLCLTTYVGEGLLLEGSEAQKEVFRQSLLKSAAFSVNKNERKAALYLSVLNSDDWQKLYYYARQFDVSEATISLDLDSIRAWFEKSGIELLTRQGLGVCVRGEESDIRQAIVSHLINSDPKTLSSCYLYPPASVKKGVTAALHSMGAQLDWMTQNAYNIFCTQVIVQVTRLLSYKTLNTTSGFSATGLQAEISKKIAELLKEEFSISFCEAELHYIAKALRAARAKQRNPLNHKDTQSFVEAQMLAYKLIEAFDRELSPVLKLDEQLVRGLSLHLWSALVRIQSGYIIEDPMGEQIKAQYPEIYEKTLEATKVLPAEEEISSGEISCIATYFGAAMLKIAGDKSGLRVCVVCMAGIGVSYMMAGQLKVRFATAFDVEVGSFENRDNWEEFDVLISTVPIEDAKIPVVVVNPILGVDDYEKIKKVTAKITSKRERELTHVGSLTSSLREAASYFEQMQKLLNKFDIKTVSGEQSVEGFSGFAAKTFGTNEEKCNSIYDKLMQRENISSQLIEELSIVILHCISQGVKEPVFVVLYPESGTILNKAGAQAKVCMLMLLPKDSGEGIRAAMGAISSLLVEDDDFLHALHHRDEQVIRNKIEAILRKQIKINLEKLI